MTTCLEHMMTPAVGFCRRKKAIVLTLLLALGGLGFIILAESVSDRHTDAFDRWAIQGLRRADDLAVPVGPAWVARTARDISALGSVSVLSLVTAGATGLLLIARKRSTMLFLIGIVMGGMLLVTILKECFGRMRPSLVPHLDVVTSPSFPSGHSMLAAIVYLTVGVLAARAARSRRTKAYILVVAGIITLLVGGSRVVLGVHYPTDVLAGWIGGIVWALACSLVANRMQRGAAPRDDMNGV